MPKEWLITVEGGSGLPAPDLDEVRRALAVLVDPEYGFQLHFAPFHKESFQTFSGTDLDGACAWVEEHGSATGIYYTMNPVSPDLAWSAKVPDVLRRRWLLIDVDRNKTHSPDDSATEEEHEAARALALSIRDCLDGLGWSAPLLIDSGNGFHLLYQIDLECGPPAKCPSQKLIAAFLKALAGRFDDERGSIGAECHDARRIAKLPGTWARRGQETSRRPWRLARLLHQPASLEIVTREQLEAIAHPPVDQVQIETLHDWSIPVTSGSEAAYARSAFERECGRLALAPRGELNDTAYQAAAACGNFVGAGLLDEAEVFSALLRALQSAGGNNPAKDENVIRRGLEKGKSEPRVIPGQPAATRRQSSRVDSSRDCAPTLYSLPVLLGLHLPPPAWLVPGLLSEGLTILAGKPKLGKSWLALNLALTIAAGGKALGSMDVEPADVLYLSLEDRLRRVQDRAKKVLAGLKFAPPGALDVAVEWPRQADGGLDHLKRWLDDRKRRSAVIVDVWAKFRPLSLGGRSAYDQDYEHISALKKVVDQRDSSALLIMHCKKAKAEDILDEVSGTLGLAGSTDGTLVLTRARSEMEAELFVTGRDVEEGPLALEFDPKGFIWTCHGKAADHAECKYRADLFRVFQANPGVTFSPKDLAERLNVPETQQPGLRRVLRQMVEKGEILQPHYGRYRWPVRGTDEYEA